MQRQKTNFAAWGMFIDKQTECGGVLLVGARLPAPSLPMAVGPSETQHTLSRVPRQADANAGYSSGGCVKVPLRHTLTGIQAALSLKLHRSAADWP